MAGDVDTGLIARDIDKLTQVAEPTALDVAAAAMTAMGLSGAPAPMTGFSLWAPLPQTVHLTLGDAAMPITVAFTGPAVCDVSSEIGTVALNWINDCWRGPTDPMPKAISYGDSLKVFGVSTHVFGAPDPLDRGSSGTAGDGVMSPMPGLIQEVAVTLGQTVAEGDRLVVLEAMKMEHVLRAPRDGVVARLSAAAGDQVVAGVELVGLEEIT